ncbi:unnamed protein product [Rotaria sp. Silwood1]|nr:unnamed protein product [Rotaria sp. Silwood1]CAF1662805.1 unnamed protein product [Rotaria sp. Silwood1]CAF3814884.1 unnamed protein product [Rotaria sp. Silwood1]CAF4894572.1 unnamed protein product [Rotaria sp. Silwood1]
MTDDFAYDEAVGTAGEFASDDKKYGNSETGDGFRFRRRGLFGLRGRTMYERFEKLMAQYQTLAKPERAAIIENAMVIASTMWKKPNLQNGTPLTQYADGTFLGFSMLWFKLTGGIEKLPIAAKQYAKFLRALECGGDLYPGQGQKCQFNATHQGFCTPYCIRGLEESGEICGCTGEIGPQCPDSPSHIRCCVDSCSQELKMDLGFVLDASGSIGATDFQKQRIFVGQLLRQVNVGPNKTHVGIVKYSSNAQVLTYLNRDYTVDEKIRVVNTSVYNGGSTQTSAALQAMDRVFSLSNGLRKLEEGASRVIFVITDGASDNQDDTINAAAVLKDQGIHLVSVGVGSSLNLIELHAICTPPMTENYFPIVNYAALEQKINQFTSKTCSEPVPLPGNTTVNGTIGKDKYKFLKIKIEIIGNKIKITLKLFNGKVKLFYSFNTRNPKDPQDFIDYETKTSSFYERFISLFKSHSMETRASSDEMEIVISQPDTNSEFLYVGVKGVEDDNSFEVKFDDCQSVICNVGTLKSPINLISMIILIISTLLFRPS